MSVHEELISKFKDEKSKTYYIRLKWLDSDDDTSGNYINVLLVDSINAWKSNFSRKQFERALNLKSFDNNFDDVEKKFLDAFKSNSNKYAINVGLNDDFTVALLNVKEKIDNDMKVGIVDLRLAIVDDASVEIKAIFDSCLNQIDKLKSNIEYNAQMKLRADNERSEALKDYEKCIEFKSNIENELFSKFLLILNEKKRKIRELENVIDDMSQNRPTQATQSNNESDSEGSKEKKDDEASNNEDDDDDKKEMNKSPLQKATATKSIFKKKERKNNDDSLRLDEDDNEDNETKKKQAKQIISLTQKRKLRNRKSNKDNIDYDEDEGEEDGSGSRSKANEDKDELKSKRLVTTSLSRKGKSSFDANSSLNNKSINDVDDLIDKI